MGLPPEQVVGYAKLVVGQKSFDAIAHSEGRSGNVLPFWGEGAVKPVFIETRPLRKAQKSHKPLPEQFRCPFWDFWACPSGEAVGHEDAGRLSARS